MHRLGVRGRNLLSDFAHRMEIRNLRGRISFALLPMALLVGPSVLVTPMDRAYRVGEFRASEAPLMLAVASVTTAFLRPPFYARS
ncbi:MAG: hypothetical protein AVDCRST_MAG55-1699 [uncultured Rubrobacteraceae bacterium]|uniref:Uncharacterized protein n=1 Tax=uncultured Rubrobacteraceae bacterium TaxID=349277 RepID=A0A6J4PI73_9ACTN|nr:MAG: hypothetical protein AVDCRST_MAG55-1699 [uncultured Rubrobacteraceae bacterium]